MKKIKHYIVVSLLAVFAFTSCADPELDPLQFKNTKQGALIALRGAAYDYLVDDSELGEIATFSISNPANAKFEFDAEYISKEVGNLSKIEVYARFKQEARVKVATIEGSTFTIPSGGRYPYGKISVPLATILSALGKKATDFAPEDMIRVESDLILSDGSSVPASSVVNSSLFETAHFYPAHSLLYMAVR